MPYRRRPHILVALITLSVTAIITKSLEFLMWRFYTHKLGYHSQVLLLYTQTDWRNRYSREFTPFSSTIATCIKAFKRNGCVNDNGWSAIKVLKALTRIHRPFPFNWQFRCGKNAPINRLPDIALRPSALHMYSKMQQSTRKAQGSIFYGGTPIE